MRASGTLINTLIGLATVGALLSLGAVFSAHHWLFDLISHFRVQYLVLLLPIFLLAIFYKKTVAVLIISLALAIHAYALTMSLLAVSVKLQADYQEISVLNANLFVSNSNYTAQLDMLDEIKPDIVTYQEYTHAWHKALSTQLTQYPYRITQPRAGAFGIALYSRYPILSGVLENAGNEVYPLIDANIDMGEHKLRVVAVHPPPPISQQMYAIRNNTLQKIATIANTQNKPLIVAGDFNTTPWTAHFSQMLSIGGLRSASAGFGFQPTWPASVFLPLRIPIDHILVNGRVGVSQFEAKYLAGSDHKSIIGRLRIY